MNPGQTIFAQVMEFAPRYEFGKCVSRYRGDYKVQSFTCWEQFLCMAFAQLTYRESLRDIAACLRGSGSKRYHMGIRSRVSRNTLANANATRDWRIYADFAQTLIGQARALYAQDSPGFDFEHVAYALDSTTIDLCLAVFPWAPFQRSKAAIKMHTLLDLRGCIPSVIVITTARSSDVAILDSLAFEPGAFYVMDRAYTDFRRLRVIERSAAFFVTRARKNLCWRGLCSHPVDQETGVQCDQTIALSGRHAPGYFPEPLRRIRYKDPQTGKGLVFLTNNHELPAITIARLYRARWQVELFFKWVKQHLRIKAFYGTSANAVKTQLWIAISVYLLVAIMKKRLGLSQSLHQILQIVSVMPFEKIPFFQAFEQISHTDDKQENANQLILFD